MFKRVIATMLTALALTTLSVNASAEEVEEVSILDQVVPEDYFGHEDYEFNKARATAYCLKGITRSGEYVRDGICASGNPEYFGKIIIMYQRLPDGTIGSLIGIYECLDTGCSKYVIDVWHEDLEACQQFMNRVYEDNCGGKIFIQVVDKEDIM